MYQLSWRRRRGCARQVIPALHNIRFQRLLWLRLNYCCDHHSRWRWRRSQSTGGCHRWPWPCPYSHSHWRCRRIIGQALQRVQLIGIPLMPGQGPPRISHAIRLQVVVIHFVGLKQSSRRVRVLTAAHLIQQPASHAGTAAVAARGGSGSSGGGGQHAWGGSRNGFIFVWVSISMTMLVICCREQDETTGDEGQVVRWGFGAQLKRLI